MEGFLNLRLNPWLRRLLTRGLALIPAVGVIYFSGDKEVYQLLILSQVVLSLQLPFAVIPLVRLTSDRERMGTFANRPWVLLLSGAVSAVILFMNGWLVKETISNMLSVGTNVYFYVVPGSALAALLLYLLVEPWSSRRTASKSAGLPIPALEMESVAGDLPVYRKILVPLDHSPSDRLALQHAVALAKQSGARLILLHVEEGATSQVYGPASSTAEVAGGANYLSEISQAITKQNITCDFFIHHSTSPSGAISRFAKEEKPDLIVMAAHGHGTLGDILYGQTIEQVRHAVKIPLFVVQ